MRISGFEVDVNFRLFADPFDEQIGLPGVVAWVDSVRLVAVSTSVPDLLAIHATPPPESSDELQNCNGGAADGCNDAGPQ